MNEHSQRLDKNLELLWKSEREKSSSRPSPAHRTFSTLLADLVAARRAAGLTQEEVRARMWTTKCAISRLECGVRTHPSLRTVEKYALAVGALVEIRVRTRR